MCGRFVLGGEPQRYADYLGADRIEVEAFEPSYNVAPTDSVLTVVEQTEERYLGTMKWGYLAHWAKDRKSIQINARLETVDTKALFAESFSRRRCLIPADGFYEWGPADIGRAPHWIFRADGFPVAFAGIWSVWRDPQTGIKTRTCAIITTKSAGVVTPIHDRMPVILSPDSWDEWLDREVTDLASVRTITRPIDPEILMTHPVSAEVNSVRNNHPGLTARLV